LLRPLLLVLCALLPAQAAFAKLEVGTTAPEALGKSKEGELNLSQFRGRVVVVTFWASWCGPCRRELPVLDVLKRAAGDRAEVVAVNVKDPIQSYHAITRQLKDTPMIFARDANGKIADSFGVTAYPNLFVIDQAGKIAAVHVGFSDKSLERIIGDINLLLEKPAAAAPAPAAAGAR
jgi:thiol-disulfide isomerase/thioredoxin